MNGYLVMKSARMLVDGVMDRPKDRQHYATIKLFSSSKCTYKTQQLEP